jgi:2-oxoglutarate ferredoxin oxidoreductase subunit beta
MSETEKKAKLNQLGFDKTKYKGSKSTLCTGCGHDSITNHIITALFQSSINPYKVAKMSGIGCSSKTPTYFLEKSHGFNSIHGRMAPLATGVKLANPELVTFGVSGDGDTASIGMGGFAHMIRRNPEMVYIVENNGVYGLTKGQFSATADEDTTLKSGEANPFAAMDLCSLAIDLGCKFVARSFSGDAKQLVPLIDAALRHRGTAFIDVISPCITFANHEGSTKSFQAVKDHKVNFQEFGFIQSQEEIKVDYDEGESQDIELHDGSHLILKKLDSKSHDLKDSVAAISLLHESRKKGEILTGLFYFDPESKPLHETMNLTGSGLVGLGQNELHLKQSELDAMQALYS